MRQLQRTSVTTAFDCIRCIMTGYDIEQFFPTGFVLLSVFLNAATIAVMGNTEFECLFIANNAESVEIELESALFATNKHSNSVFPITAMVAVFINTEFECLFVANNADSNSISTVCNSLLYVIAALHSYTCIFYDALGFAALPRPDCISCTTSFHHVHTQIRDEQYSRTPHARH